MCFSKCCGGSLLRELSILEPSGEGNEERSKTVILVLVYCGLWVSAYAADSPKTPDPTIKTEEGTEPGMVDETTYE